MTPPAPQAPKRNWVILSDLVGRLEVRCDECQRRGLYRVDRLMADVGDMAVSEALQEIASRAGCARALKPPALNDVNYTNKKCQIRRVAE